MDIISSLIIFLGTWLFVLLIIRGDINDIISEKKSKSFCRKTNKASDFIERLLFIKYKQYISRKYYIVNLLYVFSALLFLITCFIALFITEIRPLLFYVALGKLPIDAIILIYDIIKTRYGYKKFK